MFMKAVLVKDPDSILIQQTEKYSSESINSIYKLGRSNQTS